MNDEQAGIVKTGPVAEKADISQPTSHEINEASTRLTAELSRAREELTRHQRHFPSLLADVATGLTEEGGIEEVRQHIALFSIGFPFLCLIWVSYAANPETLSR
jgi:hypothetical protein